MSGRHGRRKKAKASKESKADDDAKSGALVWNDHYGWRSGDLLDSTAPATKGRYQIRPSSKRAVMPTFHPRFPAPYLSIPFYQPEGTTNNEQKLGDPGWLPDSKRIAQARHDVGKDR